MIVVKVELHSAVTGKVTELGVMHISNDGSLGNTSKGNYDVTVFRKNSDTINCKGRVENHARHSLSIWSLLRKALQSVSY